MSSILEFKRPRSHKAGIPQIRRGLKFLGFLVLLTTSGVILGKILPLRVFTPVTGSKATISGAPQVIDGDTIHIGETRIRLAGIDAPESHQECFYADGGSYACGAEATSELAGLVRWQTVHCEKGDKDRYGRTLATCYVGATDINAAMVRSGWAVAYRNYSSKYIPQEDQARSEKAGLWQGQFKMPWDWRRIH